MQGKRNQWKIYWLFQVRQWFCRASGRIQDCRKDICRKRDGGWIGQESVGFQKLTTKQAETVLSNTTFIVNAVYDEKSVGIVRVLTDMLTDAYITDVIVNPDF